MSGVASASQIASRVGSRADTAAEVVGLAIARAREVQSATNAFITIAAEHAIERAAEVDRQIAAGARLPLAGVPVVVKDNICTRGIRTTAGSRLLEDFVPPYSATVVARLEAAGAVVIAKANCDEFGMGSSNESSAFGPVRNPWDLARVPGGSSGGSAVAVATGVAPLALGTDTGGSVRQPAGFTGVIGYKPTYGLLSRYGVVAYASSLDQVGVMTWSVDDVRLAMEAMAGRDPADATTVDAPEIFEPDARGAADAEAAADGPLAGLRVGIVAELSGEGNDPDVREVLGRTRDDLERLGADVHEVSLPTVRFGVSTYYLIATAEASSNLSRYDGTLYGRRVGEDALGQAQAMMASRGAGFGAEVQRRVLMGTYALSAGYRDAYYERALRARRILADDMARAFESVDLLLTPTAPTPAFRLGERTGDPLAMYVGDVDSCLANLAGIGAISLPGGVGERLPCGVQLMAPALRDGLLWSAARALEARAGGRLGPLAPRVA